MQRKQQHNLNLDGFIWGYLFLENFCVSNEQNFFNLIQKKPKTFLRVCNHIDQTCPKASSWADKRIHKRGNSSSTTNLLYKQCITHPTPHVQPIWSIVLPLSFCTAFGPSNPKPKTSRGGIDFPKRREDGNPSPAWHHATRDNCLCIVSRTTCKIN